MSKPTYTVDYFDILLCIFVTLKLTGLVSWSWWWVLSPIWIAVVIAIIYEFVRSD